MRGFLMYSLVMSLIIATQIPGMCDGLSWSFLTGGFGLGMWVATIVNMLTDRRGLVIDVTMVRKEPHQ